MISDGNLAGRELDSGGAPDRLERRPRKPNFSSLFAGNMALLLDKTLEAKAEWRRSAASSPLFFVAAIRPVGHSFHRGSAMPMPRILFVALCLFGCLAASSLLAQSNGLTAAPPRTQSLQGTLSSCAAGGQSSRICNDDFRSCNDTCNQDITAGIDPTICSSRCCTYFNACMLVHQCITTPTQCD